jgi:hypothetical protein
LNGIEKTGQNTADLVAGEHPVSAQRRARRESSHKPTAPNEVSAVKKRVVPSRKRGVELEAQLGATRATPNGTKMEVPGLNAPSSPPTCADVRHF